MNDIIAHYNQMIAEGNDPYRDPPILQVHMDKWDGKPFLEALMLDHTKDVLEIGVGTGRIAAKTLPLCRRLVGIDISEKTIERAKVNLYEYENLALVCGDFYTNDFQERFDVIYSSLTFMHFQEKERAVKKAVELLRDHGRIVLALDKNQQPFIDYGVRKIEIWPDDPGHIAQLLEQNGLQIVQQFETEFSYIIDAEQ